MKRRSVRVFSSILACVLLMSCMFSSAFARASDYFAYTFVNAAAVGGGRVTFEFDVNTTHTMDEVGASRIIVWERQSDGTYDNVKTYTRYNTSGLIEKDATCAYAAVTYQGKSGTDYYATVTFYAKDENGSGTYYSNTGIVTA